MSNGIDKNGIWGRPVNRILHWNLKAAKVPFRIVNLGKGKDLLREAAALVIVSGWTTRQGRGQWYWAYMGLRPKGMLSPICSQWALDVGPGIFAYVWLVGVEDYGRPSSGLWMIRMYIYCIVNFYSLGDGPSSSSSDSVLTKLNCQSWLFLTNWLYFIRNGMALQLITPFEGRGSSWKEGERRTSCMPFARHHSLLLLFSFLQCHVSPSHS